MWGALEPWAGDSGMRVRSMGINGRKARHSSQFRLIRTEAQRQRVWVEEVKDTNKVLVYVEAAGAVFKDLVW